MSVVSNQKRKRPTADHSLGYETEEDDTGSIKARKVDQNVQLVSADASDLPGSLLHSTAMNIDENISSVGKSIDYELPNYLNEQRTTGHQIMEPTSAHKKILQRQWSAEAHGHVRKIHSIQDESIEIEEESIGTEILSLKCHFESSTILDVNMSAQNRNGSGKTVSLVKANGVTADDALPKKDVAKAVSKPRVSVQRPAGVSIDKRAIVTPLLAAGDLESISKAASISDPATCATALLSSTVEPPTALSDSKESEDIKDVPKVPRSNTRTKVIILWVVILGFLSIAAAVYLSLGAHFTNSSETQGGEVISSNDRATDLMLIPEVDDPVFSRSEQLLQQLDKLEQEASQLADIINYAATHEAEAQVQLEALRAEQTKLQIDATASIRNIESAIAAREEKISAMTEAALSLVKESEGFVSSIEAKNKEEEEAINYLTAIADKEKLLESFLPRLESGILLRVTDISADSTVDIDVDIDVDVDALLEDVADGLDDVDADDEDNANAEGQLSDTESEEEPLEKDIGTGIPTPEVDMSEDVTVTIAVSRAEDALSSLDQELAASAMDIDREIREHVSAQAKAAYVRYTEAASAASAASAAAVIASASGGGGGASASAGGGGGAVANKQSVPVIDPVTINSEIPVLADPTVAFTPDHHLDYAVWPRGGRVVPYGETTTFRGQSLVLTSPPYVLSQGAMKSLRYKLRLGRDIESADESVLVSHSAAAAVDSTNHQAEPYSCYAFAGSTGSVTVTMHSPVQVSTVQVLHRQQSEGDTSTNAPKKFRLIGWTENPSAQPGALGRDLGTFEYDISGVGAGPNKGLQSFSVMRGTAELPAFKAITVSVLSNHGDPTHTSICRIKVLGELAK